MQLHGLGHVGQLGPGPASGSTGCGDNPCGLFDYVWLSNGCQVYLGCADPTNPLYVGATQGAAAAVGSSFATVFASFFNGISTSTGIPVSALYVGAGVLAFLVGKEILEK